YRSQPLHEWIYMGMKQITGSGGNPSVFRLAHDEDGLWLDNFWALPDHEWYPVYEFVFRLRPRSSEQTTTAEVHP
ncbi:MAG: hypothetical protein AAB691_01020, partial [Patescibacteria group bacterium]